MSSQDVIHSFWVPSLRVKYDVLPNRYSRLWFEALKEGEFPIMCTEFCGKGHSEMIGKLRVVSEAEYTEWLEAESFSGEGMTPEEWGEELYKSKACFTCHSLDGSVIQGPSWVGIFGTQESLTDGSTVLVDENYIRQSVLEPTSQVTAGFQPIMPSYQGLLKEKEIDALIAFIKSLAQ